MYALAIHGGAGTMVFNDPAEENKYKSALEAALNVGFEFLKKGKSALEAVEASVISLENCELFNAGKGSVFTTDETHEMDAAIMRGDNLEAGAVAGVRGVKNPIRLAKEILENSYYLFLSGEGAEKYARELKLPFKDARYFYNDYRHQQLLQARKSSAVLLDNTAENKFGTVGAVALDVHGNLAAATSTGGLTNKDYGRIGDSPLIGAGTYANNATCAISCTGYGEYFIRTVAAYDVSCLIEYKGLSLKDACQWLVNEKLLKMGGEGGLIAIDKMGNIELPFNTEGMYRAWRKEGGEANVAINR